jgi:hypothetical protein
LPYNSSGDFNPDLLLCVFAVYLASKRLSFFDVKVILEKEGFFEPDKVSIEEMDAAFCKMFRELEPAFERLGWGGPPTHDSDPRPPPDAPKYHRLRDALDGIQALMRMPQTQKLLWKTPPNALLTSMDEELAKEYHAVVAAIQLLALTHPETQNIISNLDEFLARLARANRKSAHRPPSDKHATRFRTAAVAAAECYRATGVSPRDSRQWVATCLNRAGLRRDTAGSLFNQKRLRTTRKACSKVCASSGALPVSLVYIVAWSPSLSSRSLSFLASSARKKLLNSLC